MKKIFLLATKTLFLFQLILLSFSQNISAQVLYAENFGTTTGGLPTGWTSSNSTDGWRRVTTTPSGTYTGASGGANITFANTGASGVSHTLTYANNLATTGAYTQVTVIWGARATNAFNQIVTFEWRNGNAGAWTNAPYTQVASNGNWALINANVRLNLVGALGSTNLQFRFTVTSTSNSAITYSIDDFSVVGSSAVNNDCRQVFNTNRLVCGTTTFSDNSNGSGINDFDNTIFPNNQRGCLGAVPTVERQSAWYAFRVRTAGSLTFNIVPALITNDYDWAIWGPFNSMDANFNCQNLGAPIRCNYSGPSAPAPITGLTGMNLTSTSPSLEAGGPPFSQFMNVTPGQIYILLVNNFNSSTTPFTLVWNTATVTASNGNIVSGGGGTATLAAASPGFRTPVTLSCNRATFINQSATCDGTLSYMWDFGDGQPVTAVNSQKDPVYLFQAAGTYAVKLTITINSPGSPNDGLTESFTSNVTVTGAPPTASITGLNANYCIDSPPINLVGTGNPVGGTSNFTIQPNGSATGQITNATQFNPATLGVGTHSVILQYTSPLNPNCIGQTIQQVVVSPKVPPTITGLASSYCPTSPVVNLVGSPAGGSFTVNGTAATQFNPASLGIGTHTVVYTVTNSTTTCVSSLSQTVSVTNLAPTSITGLNTFYCVGGNPVTLAGTPVGGTFTINGTAATQFNPTILGVGNHTVVYTAAGCASTATQIVEVRANPTLAFTGLNLNYCVSAAAFTLQATPTGGTFKINNIAATQFNPTSLGVGTHTVLYEYTDPANSSCSNSLSQTVNVLALPTLAITNLNANYCITASAVTLAATPAGGTFTVNGSPATQFIPSTLGVGTHTVVYSFTDANGCANTRTQTSQVLALPVLAFVGLNNSYCESNPAFNLSATPTGGTFTINGTTATQFNATTLGINNHTVVYTFTDANGCTNTLSRSVAVIAKPVLSFVGLNVSYCANNPSFALQATPAGGTFKIDGNTVTQFNASSLAVGMRTVTYDYTSPTNAGCFNTISQIVEIKALPVVTLTGLNTSYCVTAPSFALTGTPAGGTFTINGTAATQFNPASLGAGNQSVVYSFTDANGCTNTATQSVTINALPVLTNNLSVAYCLSSAIVNMTGTPGGTFTINGTAATQFNPGGLGIGTYTVVQSFTDANGCSNTLTKTVNVNIKPVLNFVSLNNTYCINNPSFALQANPTGGTFTINGTAATQFNPATLGVGIYTIKYNYVSPTDPGCFNDITQIVEVKPLPVVTLTGLNNAYCITAPSFALTGTPANGTFTINGTAATQFNPLALGAGNHTVVYSFTDGNGCTNTNTKSVVVNPLPVLAFVNLNNSYCDSNPTFNLSATPAGGTFTINGTAATQFNAVTLGVGNYNIVYSFTDANGCSNTLNKSVTITPKPVLNFVGLNTFYCINNPSFALQANLTGGVFKIDGNIVTQFNPSALSVGMHVVTYDYATPADAGCFNSISQNVDIKPLPVVTLTGLNNAYCISVPTFALTATPTGGTFTINGTAATQFNPLSLGAGTHTVVYSFTDGNGCTNTNTKSVVVNPLPVLAFVNLNDTYCNSNAAVVLNATPTGGTFTVNGLSATQFNPVGLGNYTIIYNYTDANGCSSNITKVVTVISKPALNFVGLNTFYCVNNPSFALQANPTGGTFRINTITATQFNPATLGVGMHTVTYNYVSPTDAGCFNTINQVVEVKPIPTINITNLNSSYCISAGSVPLTATPIGGTFTLNGTAATQFTPATLGTGSHTVVYSFTDGNGCTNTSTRTIVVNPLPVLAFVNLKDSYCTSSATFNLSASPADGTFTVNGTSATQFNPATLGVGNYTVVYSFTDVNGCSNQISKPVAVQSKPTVVIVGLNAGYCISDASFALSATPVGGTFTINGTEATQFNPATLGAGTYNVKYNYIDPSDAGCFNDITQVVKVVPLPQIEWQGILASYCVSQLTPVIPSVKITYADGTIVNQAQSSFTPAMVGASSQTLSFTAIDPMTSCQRTSTFSYVINALPVLSFVNVPDEYCSQANPLTLQASPAGGQMLIQGVATNILNPTLFAVNTDVSIQYTFTAAGTGCTNTINKVVKIVENPNFQEVTFDLDVCPQSSTIGYRLEAMTFLEEQALINAGNTPIYQWSNGTDGRFVALRTESDGGSYTVLIKEQSGCPIKKITFNVVVSCEPELFLPTAFSPNGDNLNDTWDIYGGDLYKLEITVYNRWGEIVFISYGQNESWDGKRYGLNLPDGSYAWKAKYQNALKPGTWIYKQGSVTIVR
ncbi:MAG: gliding motility-associated C-terminal domain-containing protein [Bacteroidetes bacterium]|nr:MAG: gliding motility-associated C-terminal domain-containing protein [Bacteroidota bacterium]TAG87757.1 MAG: gliding motility-associated C-terminal domain-containing protein [Bacteroidota bacterium]